MKPLALSAQIGTDASCSNSKAYPANCPKIAGIEPLYNPLSPICGSFDTSSGKESADACTRV